MTKKAVLYFAAVTAAFFAPLLWGETFIDIGFLYKTPLWYNPEISPERFDLFDSTLATYPYQELLRQGLRSGEFPFWSPYNFAGTPIAFNGQSGLFYPPRILLLYLFPTWLAHAISLALHTFVAGLAGWFLGRRFNLSPLAAAFFGTAWMFNPYMVGWLLLDITTVCGALIPLALLAVERCRRDWKGAAWLALSLALMLTGGHLQFVMYSIFSVVLLGLILLVHVGFTRIVWARLALAGLLAGLLSAPALFPTAYYLSTAQRPSLGLDFIMSTHRQFLATAAPSLFLPEFWGDGNSFAVKRIFNAGDFVAPELCLYFGVITLVLALTSLRVKGPARWLMGLSLLILFLPATPLYMLVQAFPGLDRVNSTRSIQIVHLLVALAAGFGLDQLKRPPGRKLGGAGMAVLLILAGGLASWACFRDPAPTLAALARDSAIRLPPPEIFLTPDGYRQAVFNGFTTVYSWSNPAVFVPLFCLLVATLVLYLDKKPRLWLLGLLALDLFVVGKSLVPHHPSSLLFPENPAVRLLQQAGVERVLGLGTVKPNTLSPLRVHDVAGYDSFYPRHSSEYLSVLLFGEFDPNRQLPQQVFPIRRFQTPLVDLMGTRFIVAYPGQELEGKELVSSSPLNIYSNPSRLPRAFLVQDYLVEPDSGAALTLLDQGKVDPRKRVVLLEPPPLKPGPETKSSAEIRFYGLNRVVVETKAEENSLLVLTDAYTAGWKASVDGSETTVLRGDVMFRVVPVPAGTHLVEFHFEPVYFRQGLFLMALGLALLIALLLI